MNSEAILSFSGGARYELNLRSYPDGMPLVNALQDHLTGPRAMLLRPRTLNALCAALFWVDAERERGHAIPEFVLPCFPGARQDRLNESGDSLFTAKSVAAMINARAFPRVTVVDPHSDVAPALLDRCRVVRPHDFMRVPPGKYHAVVSPDAGAEKRAAGVAKLLGVPLLHGWKKRDVSTGALSGFGLEPTPDLPKDASVLVIDDICDGGGTFLGLADVLDARGLRAHLYVTHGLFTKGTDKLIERFHGHVYCTDSTLGERPGVIEIPICDRLLKGAL